MVKEQIVSGQQDREPGSVSEDEVQLDAIKHELEVFLGKIRKFPIAKHRSVDGLMRLVGLELRSKEANALIKECYNYLDEKDIKNTERALDNLVKLVGEYDTEVIKIRTLIDFFKE